MDTLATLLGALSTICWLGFALLPWRPWSTQETLDATGRGGADYDLSQITVLIPARNEDDLEIGHPLPARKQARWKAMAYRLAEQSEFASAGQHHGAFRTTPRAFFNALCAALN